MSDNTIKKLIQVIEDYNKTESIPFSAYKELMALVRELQVEK